MTNFSKNKKNTSAFLQRYEGKRFNSLSLLFHLGPLVALCGLLVPLASWKGDHQTYPLKAHDRIMSAGNRTLVPESNWTLPMKVPVTENNESNSKV